MNQKINKIYEERVTKLERSLRYREQEAGLGIFLFLIGVLFGVLSFELIIGIILIVWGFTQKSKIEKELFELKKEMTEKNININVRTKQKGTSPLVKWIVAILILLIMLGFIYSQIFTNVVR